MEVATVKYKGSAARWRIPLLRLQPDERLIAAMRAGNHAAFDVLVARYQGRLLGFCERLLRSREDAEDVLQEVFARAFTAILADDRPIHARPWLYRIARNRSLNHLRRTKAIGVDSMDDNQADHGQNTADKAHRREDFRLLLGDINALPDSQRSALVLREMKALSYEQIADVMDKTVPSVKSLLVRARSSLAGAAQARALPCDEVELELQQLASGRRGTTPAARRHLRSCERCRRVQADLGKGNGRAALIPVGLLAVAKGFALRQLGRSTSAGATATGATGPTVIAGSSAGGIMSTGLGAAATKAAVGLTAATLGVAGAVAVNTGSPARSKRARHALPSVLAYDGRPQPPAAVGSTAAPIAGSRTTSPTRTDRDTTQTQVPAAATAPAPATATTPTTQTSQSHPASRSTTSSTAQTASAGSTSTTTGAADAGSPATTQTDTAPSTVTSPGTTPTTTGTAH